MRRKNSTLLVGLSGLMVVGLAACTGGSPSGSPTTHGSSRSAADRGGTLYYLANTPTEHLDPQRTYSFRGIANETRLVYRTLTTFPTASGAAATKVVPDLATSTGKASKDSKTWTFTLKDGITWQDGKPITCADVRYGVSRTFATSVITGGPNYAIQYLDIPTKPDGSSVYQGPYARDAKGQKLFDRAVQCHGKSITFHLNKSVPDFNSAVYLPAFAPYRKDKDHGDKNNFVVFSDGPYKLEGTWNQGGTNTFVRNPQWNRSSDDVRKALPDRIVIKEGLDEDVIGQRLMADAGNDRNAVTDVSLPPQFIPQVLSKASAKARVEQPQSPAVDHLALNFTSKVMKNKAVREALAVATDKAGYVTALGGRQLESPAFSVISPAVKGYQKINPFNTRLNGDPARAKKILQDAGVHLPVAITYLYDNTGATAQRAAAALQETWNRAGFKVTLHGESQNYLSIVADPSAMSTWDVCWGNWGADWPNPSTVIPPLFDSRVNLSKDSNGKDSGRYASPRVNHLIDESYRARSADEQAQVLQRADQVLQEDVAYIPLAVGKSVYLHGSNVTHVLYNPSLFAYPDLGSMGITQ